jgi:hypothetical protein
VLTVVLAVVLAVVPTVVIVVTTVQQLCCDAVLQCGTAITARKWA